VSYCGRDCQKRDHTAHVELCKRVSETRKAQKQSQKQKNDARKTAKNRFGLDVQVSSDSAMSSKTIKRVELLASHLRDGFGGSSLVLFESDLLESPYDVPRPDDEQQQHRLPDEPYAFVTSAVFDDDFRATHLETNMAVLNAALTLPQHRTLLAALITNGIIKFADDGRTYASPHHEGEDGTPGGRLPIIVILIDQRPLETQGLNLAVSHEQQDEEAPAATEDEPGFTEL
jgi:hypothetical protein